MTAIIEQATAPLVVDPSILETVSEKAKAVDAGTEDARYILPILAEAGLLDTDLLTAARTVREISRRDLSVGFTIWAHLMTQTYLANANKPAASAVEQSLRSGARPGITGMAAAFKEFAGCGEIELAATPVEVGFRVTG